MLSPFVTNVQFLAWLIFHPSAWREYVNHLDLDDYFKLKLTPNFKFGRVSKYFLKNREITQLFTIAFVIQPLGIGLLIVLIALPWAPFSSSSDICDSVICWGMTSLWLCFIINLITGFMLSVAFGLIFSALASLLTGICFLFPIDLVTMQMTSGFFALGIASRVLISLYSPLTSLRWDLKIGSIIIGIGLTTASLIIGIYLGDGLTELLLRYFGESLSDKEKIDLINSGPVVGMFMTVGFLLFPGWRGKLLLTPLLGIIVAASLVFAFMTEIFSLTLYPNWLQQLLLGFMKGIKYSLITISFSMPYVLTSRFSNVRSGVFAGLLFASGVIFFIFEAFSHIFIIYLSFFLGLSYSRWLPVLCYPFFSAWNLYNYRLQERYPEQSSELLFRHSAFWDEHQWLTFPSLTDQLVLTYENDEWEAQNAMKQLSSGPQRSAVQAAQIELDLKSLENCVALIDIARINNRLITRDDLPGPVGNRLRTLRQISEDIRNTTDLQETYQQCKSFEKISASLRDWSLGIAGEQTEGVQRFYKIADRWRESIEKQIKKLAKDPKIPNPYVFGTVLTQGHALFVGRKQVSERLEQLLSTTACPPLLLYGQRRTGKSSLIYNLTRLLPSHFTLLFADCQNTPSKAKNEEEFLYNLSYEINTFNKKSVKNNSETVALPTLSEDTLKTNPFMRFNEWLDNLEDATGQNTLLLVLDEFEALVSAFAEGHLQAEPILGTLRHLIQHRHRFRVLIAGSHEIQEIPYWSSYFINVQRVDIGQFLETPEALQLIERPFAEFPLRYTPAAKQHVLELTRCQPSLVQLLCGKIVEMKNNQTPEQRFLTEMTDVEAAVPGIFVTGNSFFSHISSEQVTETGRSVLCFMAKYGFNAIISQKSLETEFDENLPATLKLLLKRELIERIGEGYRFQVELIRRWFERKYI